MKETYLGTKMIEAEPMTRGDYNVYRGWQIPENENPNDEGYLITQNGGYITWSPKNVFEEAYRESDAMTFGLAIEAMKKGKKVKRKGWIDGFLQIATGITYKAVDGETLECGRDAIVFIVGTSAVQTEWLASQVDMLAEDWMLVD